METKTNIQLKQKPVITHDLKVIGTEVKKRIKELNIDSLVANEETLKSLKDIRIELNKEFRGFEDQRKMVKSLVTDPYKEFEVEYKSEITDNYVPNIEKIKDKIAEVEGKIKDEKSRNVKRYFDEICIAMKIDFLEFSQLDFIINLSISENSYKKKVLSFVERVSNDIELIEALEHPKEMMVEYKKCLDAGKSINTVRARKEAIKQEQERALIRESSRRKESLLKIGMVLDQEVEAFVYNDEIYISFQDVKGFKPTEFDLEWARLDERIRESIKQANVVPYVGQKQDLKEKSTQVPNEPLKTPKIEKKQDKNILSATFRAYGTLEQLKSVGAFMKSNNIKYENVKQ